MYLKYFITAFHSTESLTIDSTAGLMNALHKRYISNTFLHYHS